MTLIFPKTGMRPATLPTHIIFIPQTSRNTSISRAILRLHDREGEFPRSLGGNSIGFLDSLTDRLKMGDGLKMSDFGLGMS